MAPSPLDLLPLALAVAHAAAAALGPLLVLFLVFFLSPASPGALPSNLPVTGDPAMAYLNRTITLTFDGVSTLDFPDEDGKPIVLPNLGDDVWVTIRNPMLMPQSMLMPKTDVPVDANGQPIDKKAALAAGAEVVAGLIVAWSLTDVLDFSDEPPVLPVPTTGEVITDHIPVAVGDTIATLLGRARNPR